MRCPRRFDDAGVFKLLAGEDQWLERDGYTRCSYCGSLSPETLFDAIKEGAELGPTDKNYKVYVDLPAKDAGELHVVSCSNFDDGSQRVADLPQPLYQRAVEDGYGSDPENSWVRFSPRRKVHGKFYFQHLSDDDKKKFIDMMNARTLNVGYPGHFYRLPFFCTRVDA